MFNFKSRISMSDLVSAVKLQSPRLKAIHSPAIQTAGWCLTQGKECGHAKKGEGHKIITRVSPSEKRSRIR